MCNDSHAEIDWGQVKKMTLWHYEDLIKRLLAVLRYDFVQECYNHSMPEAVAYSKKIRFGYLQDGREAAFAVEMAQYLGDLDALGISSYMDLVRRVSTKAKCQVFLQETDFAFEALIQTLNYLFRWVLPFRCPIRELVDTFAQPHPAYLEALKQHNLKSNLDVLDRCRTPKDREEVAGDTEIAEEFLLELAHRADISRLAYVRGKTIKHLCGGGYDTLGKIAAADLKEMEGGMSAYYKKIGKSYSDFKAVIPLDWMIGGARILPPVIEE